MTTTRVDLADTLERAADKLPDLVFTKSGDLVSGKPSKPKSHDQNPKATKPSRSKR